MKKKEFSSGVELVNNYFQKALGCEVGLEGKTASEGSEKNYVGGKVERLGSFLDPETCLTVYLEAVGCGGGGVQMTGNVHKWNLLYSYS